MTKYFSILLLSINGCHGAKGASPTATSSIADITEFGAVAGDGLDDTEAILRALTSIPSTGGVLRIPPGEFLLWQSHLVVSRSHLRLEGLPGARIRASKPAWRSAVLLSLKGAEDIEIVDLELDGRMEDAELDGGSQAHLIQIEDCQRVTIERCHLFHSSGDGIAIFPLEGKTSTDIRIRDCYLDGALRNGISVATGKHISITGSTLINWNTVGIDLEPDNQEPLSQLLIAFNWLRPAEHHLNPYNSNRLYGISLNLPVGDRSLQKAAIIIGNQIEGVEDDSHYPAAGIWLSGMKGSTIIGNQILDGRDGIYGASEPTTPQMGTGCILGNYITGTGQVSLSVRQDFTLTANVTENGTILYGPRNLCIGNLINGPLQIFSGPQAILGNSFPKIEIDANVEGIEALGNIK